MLTTVVDPVDEDITRRGFLSGLAAAGLLLSWGNGARAAEAGWSFTDDRGVEITLESQPRRVVAYETAGAALWHLGIAPVGIFGGAPLDVQNPQLLGVDLAGIASVGEVYGEINLEKLAALAPDLIVTGFQPSSRAGFFFGFVDEGVRRRAEAIAPILMLDSSADVPAGIARYEELAAALGADLQAPDVVAVRRRYKEASERLRTAAAAKPGLRAIAVNAFPSEGIYVQRPSQSPGLRQFQQLGLDLVEPASDPGDIDEDFATYFYELISFERADTYPADLILVGSETGQPNLAELAEIATWRALPAVQAGQLVPWRVLPTFSYPANTRDLELLADAVEAADPDLVP